MPSIDGGSRWRGSGASLNAWRTPRASSRCGFKLDRAVASRAYSKGSIGWAQPDPERGNVNDCAVDGILRRHTVLAAPAQQLKVLSMPAALTPLGNRGDHPRCLWKARTEWV